MTQVSEETLSEKVAPLFLVIANVLGIAIGYAITVVLARSLNETDFERYVGTIATLGLLASLAEAGFGKYGLKIIPVFVANKLGSQLRGYLRFSLFGCLGISVALGIFVIVIEAPLRETVGERVVVLAALFLPAMAGLGVAVDILIAYRLAATATFIARILVPATTLSLVCGVIFIDQISSRTAVICFGLGSLIGFCIALAMCFIKSFPLTRKARVENRFKEWTIQGFSFLAFGFLISWIFKAPLILAHHIPHHANELAMLAPAFETGCLILLLSKSTDKYFQPTMSVIIESGDWTTGVEMRRSRYVLVGLGIAVFLTIVFVFGKRILSLYGEQYVEAYFALCLVAIGSSVWTLFSLAPSFLLFVGARKALLANLITHGILLVLLTVVLFQSHGYRGAAAAYAISICSLALGNFYLANRYLRIARMATPLTNPLG